VKVTRKREAAKKKKKKKTCRRGTHRFQRENRNWQWNGPQTKKKEKRKNHKKPKRLARTMRLHQRGSKKEGLASKRALRRGRTRVAFRMKKRKKGKGTLGAFSPDWKEKKGDRGMGEGGWGRGINLGKGGQGFILKRKKINPRKSKRGLLVRS